MSTSVVCPSSLPALSAQERVLLQVAEENFVESEYAGVTRVFCAHCGREEAFLPAPDAQRFTRVHDDECLTRQARQVLGAVFDAWDDAQRQAQAEEEAKARRLQEKEWRQREKHKQKQAQNDAAQRELSRQRRLDKSRGNAG